jgi:hypothetical protein
MPVSGQNGVHFTRRATRSATIACNEPLLPPTQWKSIATFRPSVKPLSCRPRRNAVIQIACESTFPGLRNPTIGIPVDCPHPTTGHTAAAPPRTVINARRFMALTQPEPAHYHTLAQEVQCDRFGRRMAEMMPNDVMGHFEPDYSLDDGSHTQQSQNLA